MEYVFAKLYIFRTIMSYFIYQTSAALLKCHYVTLKMKYHR